MNTVDEHFTRSSIYKNTPLPPNSNLLLVKILMGESYNYSKHVIGEICVVTPARDTVYYRFVDSHTLTPLNAYVHISHCNIIPQIIASLLPDDLFIL
jgi:hypothetical protein